MILAGIVYAVRKRKKQNLVPEATIVYEVLKLHINLGNYVTVTSENSPRAITHKGHVTMAPSYSRYEHTIDIKFHCQTCSKMERHTIVYNDLTGWKNGLEVTVTRRRRRRKPRQKATHWLSGTDYAHQGAATSMIALPKNTSPLSTSKIFIKH